MKVLYAQISKEFSGYFKSYTAYIVVGVYLLLSFAATFFSAHFFEYDNQGLISFFMYQPEILNMLLPALTMKMWAEERRQGTLEFLLTQPVSIEKLVIGKFLAAFLFCMLMLMLTIPFFIYSSYLVTLDKLNVLSALIGVMCLMAALSAIGCLISAFNKNVVIAYLSTVFIGWLWLNGNFDFLLSPFKKMYPLLQHRLSGFLDLAPHYRAMTEGQITLESVIYFGSIILFALWLNVITVQWKKD